MAELSHWQLLNGKILQTEAPGKGRVLRVAGFGCPPRKIFWHDGHSGHHTDDARGFHYELSG